MPNIRDLAEVQRLARISGENVFKCMQCGTCSAVCPMADSMTITPRQGMLLLQFGRVQEVIDAQIGGHCASCHSCEVRCPRDIGVVKVYETVRQMALRDNENLIQPEAIPNAILKKAPQIAFVAGFRKLTA